MKKSEMVSLSAECKFDITDVLLLLFASVYTNIYIYFNILLYDNTLFAVSSNSPVVFYFLQVQYSLFPQV